MQSELVHLEAEIENIELGNRQSGDSEYSTLLISLFDLKESLGTKNELQWQKALEIREKLKCYSLFTSLRSHLLSFILSDRRRSSPPTSPGLSP